MTIRDNITAAAPGLLTALLAAMVLWGCPADDPGHQTVAECARQGKPTIHTPQGQRCYDK